jgi:hypothetical protein
MSTLPVADQVRNALLQNENGGSLANTRMLTPPPGSNSSYSVGAFQFDFSKSATLSVLAQFQALLQSQTNLSAQAISQIMQGITVAGGSSLVTPFIGNINQALNTTQGGHLLPHKMRIH